MSVSRVANTVMMDDYEYKLMNEVISDLHQKNETLRKALKAIIDSPGGGPAKRIAMQALAELDRGP